MWRAMTTSTNVVPRPCGYRLIVHCESVGAASRLRHLSTTIGVGHIARAKEEFDTKLSDQVELGHCTTRGLDECLPAPAAETKRGARLIVRRGLALAVIRVLIAEEFRPHRAPVDRRARIGAMLRAPGRDERALRVVQGEIAGVPPKRIPDLLNEPQSLSDRQASDVDGWIYHVEKSVAGTQGKQLSQEPALA